MKHNLQHTMSLLTHTPAALDALLRGLPGTWTFRNEGEGTWNAFDVVGHLIFGERTDWILRAKIILQFGETRTFEPFDMWGHERESQGKSLGQLLDEFGRLRSESLSELRALNLRHESRMAIPVGQSVNEYPEPVHFRLLDSIGQGFWFGLPFADAVALKTVPALTTQKVHVSPAFMYAAVFRASSTLGRPSVIRVGSLEPTPRSSQEHWPGCNISSAGRSPFRNSTMRFLPSVEAMPWVPRHRIAKSGALLTS